MIGIGVGIWQGVRDLLPWANAVAPAYAAFDFQNDRALWAGVRSQLSQVPGWTFTRASTGYALDLAGNLIPFASGALRRTDRGVLIEGARTNALLYSQDYSNATYWRNSDITIADTTAPDGTNTARSLTVVSTGSANVSSQSANRPAISGTNCVGSVYVKRGNNIESTGRFVLRDATGAVDKVTGTLTWATMTISGTGASIERLGSSDWYRVSLVDTAWTSGNAAHLYIGVSGGTFTAGHNWIVWGAQLEAASFASSYIPTTTAPVTRAADALSITGVSGITYPMTMFAEIEAQLSGTITNTAFISVSASDGTTNNRNILHYYENILAAMLTRAGGVTQADFGVVSGISRGQIILSASRSQTNSFQVARGGTLGAGDVSGSVPASPSVLEIGQNAGGSHLHSYIRRIAIWNSAFTDAQLQTQTT